MPREPGTLPPDIKCPVCRAKLDAYTAMTTMDGRPEPPAPGDLSLCIYCGIPLQFIKGTVTGEVELARMPRATWDKLSAEVQAQMTQVARVMDFIHASKKENW